jgi:two-component system cell cycle sensor histidine kinase/response regulator CckA
VTPRQRKSPKRQTAKRRKPAQSPPPEPAPRGGAPAAAGDLPGGLRFWRQLFASSPDVVVVVDQARRIAYANRPLPGRPVPAVLGADLCSYLPRQHCGRVVDVLDEVFATGTPGRFEVPVPDPGERILVYESRVVPIWRGRTVGWALLTAVDVTEQRRAERIQAATRRISEAAHTAPSLGALFGEIHGIVSELMPARNFYIALYEPAGDLISFPYLVDEFDAAPEPQRPGRGLTEYVLRTGEPLLVTPERMRDLVRRGEVQLIGADSVDWLGVPLKTEGRTIGVLVVQSYTEGVRYSETDKHILQFVSTQVAMAIERKRGEAALRASEEKFRSFIETTTDWVWSIDRDGVHTYSNPAVAGILGYEPAELVGASAFDLMHPDDREQVRAQLAALAEEGRGWRNLVIRWRHRGGGYRFLESSAVSALDAAGRLVGYRGVDRDITDRVMAEEALRTSETRLARAQAITHLGIWELELADLGDVDRNALWWSDETYRIFGYEPGRVAVSNELFWRSVHPEDVERVRLGVAEAVAGRAPYLLEHRIRRPDGTLRVVREEASLVRDASGRPVRLTGTVFDVTEQRRLEEQLRQAQKMEAVGQLAGGIAHDFNNLLTTVLAANELLSAELSPDTPHREDVETIRQAARRAAELTRNLLAFSRQQALELRAVSAPALLGDFVRLARRVVPEDVEVTLRTDAPEAVMRADPVAIEQVLMNLVTNARDAMPLGGKLTFAVGRADIDEEFRTTHGWGAPGAYVTIAITDTGAGMDAETRRHVFEPFFTTKPVGEGTGLGMAMVYGLVKQHAGFVTVYSEPAEGTTVRLYLPEAAEAAAPRHAAEVPELRGGTETVLLVEDDGFLRRTATRVLEKYGYTVVTANDGAEALSVLAARPTRPDLVISDVVMPRASGPQLLAALRAGGVAPRILFTSGYTARDVRERGLLGADVPFIAKPWTIADLLHKVREVLDRPPAS